MHKELSRLGKVIVGVSVALLSAVLLLGGIAIFEQTSGLFIALATIPLVLAASSMIWPARRLRIQKPVSTPPELTRKSLGGKGVGKYREENRDASMGELLEWTREQAKAEDERTDGFRAGAGWLLGFAGVIVALTGAQAQKVLDRAVSLGAVGRPLATWLLGMAIVLVGVAAFAALQALLPGRSRRIPTSQLNKFLADRLYDLPRVDIRFLETEKLIEQLEVDRQTNVRRLRWLKSGFGSLAVALAFLVLHIGVFLERAVETPCSGNTPTVVVVTTDSTHSRQSRQVGEASIALTASKGTGAPVVGDYRPLIATGRPEPGNRQVEERSELPKIESESCDK